MLFVINAACHYGILYNICPDAKHITDLTEIPTRERKEGELFCGEKYWVYIYEKTYTRMSPYGFGMYAAFIHVLDQ